ncbi:hypothetical protein JCM33374_g2806 [Metschnikowia sp. JCM 33374]|nr:hypothetical protein JCM33374_g2806 [Metschnikowia sp. JCM 33374]
MNFLPFHNPIKCRLLKAPRSIHFSARRLRSRDSYIKHTQATVFKRSFSVIGSHANFECSPLRRQETAHVENGLNSGINNFGSKNVGSTKDDAKETGSTGVSSVTDSSSEQSRNIEKSTDKEETSTDDYLTTIFENMEPYIDTYEVYKQLIEAGFTPSQSDEIINLLIFQLNSKLNKLSTIYSQLYELENEQYLFESAQQELHVDITRNREQHINDAINQINAMERDYSTISDELNNHFIQMKNDIQVAINDQKSENTLMSKKIMLRMQETNHKITTELNMAMRSEIESLRWHLSRWGLIAILMSIITACAGFYVYRSRHKKQLTEKNEFIPLVIYEPSEFDEDDYHADLDRNAL